MPIPKPRKDEKQDAFIGRCMGDDVMRSEYKDQKQRAAICYGQWRDRLKANAEEARHVFEALHAAGKKRGALASRKRKPRTPTKASLAKAYMEGSRAAGNEKKSLLDNPFSGDEDKPHYVAWDNGYSDAKGWRRIGTGGPPGAFSGKNMWGQGRSAVRGSLSGGSGLLWR